MGYFFPTMKINYQLL